MRVLENKDQDVDTMVSLVPTIPRQVAEALYDKHGGDLDAAINSALDYSNNNSSVQVN